MTLAISTQDQTFIFNFMLNKISANRFHKRFPRATGRQTALTLLVQAEAENNPRDVECALALAYYFGIDSDFIHVLQRLAFVDWHARHEDIIKSLDELRDESNIDAFVHAATHIPAYLAWDENQALTRKAMFGLGHLGSCAAIEKLDELSTNDDPIVRRWVAEQFELRKPT